MKTTFLVGVFFLLPLILTIFAFSKMFQLVVKTLQPVLKNLPIQKLLGMETNYLFSILALIILGFLAGLFARTAFGSRWRSSLEKKLLQFIPGYTLLVGLAEDKEHLGVHTALTSALLGTEGRWEFCFIVERHANGDFTIFKPGAPTPTRGAVFIVAANQTKELDVPVTEVMKCLMQNGGGAEKLLRGK